jgi:hypothetical protein
VLDPRGLCGPQYVVSQSALTHPLESGVTSHATGQAGSESLLISSVSVEAEVGAGAGVEMEGEVSEEVSVSALIVETVAEVRVVVRERRLGFAPFLVQ